MALDWDLTKIANQKELCWVDAGLNKEGNMSFKLHPTTETLIWMCMGIGMGKITQNNWEEWFLRARVWELAMGSLRRDSKNEVYVTPAEVKAHIGLKTNVFPKITATAFAGRLIKALEGGGRDELYKFKREQEQQCAAQQSTVVTG